MFIAFFSVFGVGAWIPPVKRSRRLAASVLGGTGIAILLAAVSARGLMSSLALSVIRDWLPAPLLVVAYRQAGQLFVRPAEAFQESLFRLDKPLMPLLGRVRAKNYLASYFELAYLLCYPVVPLGVAALYLSHVGRYADQFWALVLPPTLICYAATPLLQTLPPWKADPEGGRLRSDGGVRILNFWIIRYFSNQVNAFPSAHVATSFAIALALLRMAPPMGWVFLWIAGSIAIGAVIGRYHYTADVVAGAALAAATFVVESYLL